MSRFFIEVAYKGTRYSGFQVQQNAPTIQSEVENALATLLRQVITLTGSSRTDTGVHALQNYFHFDFDGILHPQVVYKLNAILPGDIAVKQVYQMPDQAHARFDATSRAYRYQLHRFKNPFLRSTSLYYPYQVDAVKMKEAARMIKEQTHFFAFAKTNSQVKTYQCHIGKSEWLMDGEKMTYFIEGNRFLRGMVRLLTASQLKVGRGILDLAEFARLFEGKEKCGYSVPAHGLFLEQVRYPENYFPAPGLDLTGSEKISSQ